MMLHLLWFSEFGSTSCGFATNCYIIFIIKCFFFDRLKTITIITILLTHKYVLMTLSIPDICILLPSNYQIFISIMTTIDSWFVLIKFIYTLLTSLSEKIMVCWTLMLIWRFFVVNGVMMIWLSVLFIDS